MYLFNIINTKIIGVLPKGSLILLTEINKTTYTIVGFKESIYGWLEIFNDQDKTTFNMEMDKIKTFLKEFYINGIILELQHIYVKNYIFYNIIMFLNNLASIFLEGSRCQ